MEVRKNVPPPVETPPVTYDLLGLTEEQALFLRDLMGRFCSGEYHKPHHLIYDAITAHFPYSNTDVRWKFRVTHPNVGNPILKAEKETS